MNVTTVLFLSCLLLFATGCGGERKVEAPEQAVLTCVRALENFDVATVRSMMVSTVQNDAMLASMESAASSMSEAQKQAYQAQFGNRTHHAAVTAEDDESAVVTVVIDPGVPGRGFTFELVYEGKWWIESIVFQ
jgi:glycosyltransferase A (GT-A) superfamily protein (DUF2064 family)